MRPFRSIFKYHLEGTLFVLLLLYVSEQIECSLTLCDLYSANDAELDLVRHMHAFFLSDDDEPATEATAMPMQYIPSSSDPQLTQQPATILGTLLKTTSSPLPATAASAVPAVLPAPVVLAPRSGGGTINLAKATIPLNDHGFSSVVTDSDRSTVSVMALLEKGAAARKVWMPLAFFFTPPPLPWLLVKSTGLLVVVCLLGDIL
jgi:hypothetical protein